MKLSISALHLASSELMEFEIGLKDFGSTRLPQTNCPKCGKELSWEYMQSKVYLISCPDCKVVHLVKAKSLKEALGQVGAAKEPCVDELCEKLNKVNYKDAMKILNGIYKQLETLNKYKEERNGV